ncbi:MAG: type IV pilus secretin PilQ, partial [Acidobacteriota bacterium]
SGPVAAVSVESVIADDGTILARVRLALSEPARPVVRSRWNKVIVEFGGQTANETGVRPAAPADQATKSAPPAKTPPATSAAQAKPVSTPTPKAPAAQAASAGPVANLTRIETSLGPEGTRVTFVGTGPLKASSVETARDLPPRLVVDFPNTSFSVPAVTTVGKGPVEKVRVAVNSRQPLVTRVVIDLKYPVAYRVETGGDDFAVLLDPTTPPAAATREATQVAPPPPVAAPAPAAEVDKPVPVVVRRETPPPPKAESKTEPRVASPAAPVAAPPAKPAQPEPPTTAPKIGKQYTGHPVTFDFQQADLRMVLRTFSDISKLNVVIDPTISGTVDVSLREVPWDQALEIILRANQLGYVLDNNVVRIAPLKVLAEEEKSQQELVQAQAQGGELKVLTRSLSYAKASDMQALLLKAALSTRGDVQVDARTNTLIIKDLAARLVTAEELISVLDRPEPQVEIEARIVQTTRDSARALGVQWGLSGRMAPELGNTTPLTFPSQGSISGRTGAANQGNPLGPVRAQVPAAVNLPANGATTAFGISMGSLNGALNLDIALSALEKKGNGRILSAPRVMMQNNVEAEMAQGIQIPIQTVSNNTVTVTFKEAALLLKVKPQITAANTIIMDVTLENGAADFSKQVNGIPPINTQRAKTQVLVQDNETTVIGGIEVSQEQMQKDNVPGMHKIPLLGWLFKRDSFSDESRELLIFITPKIRR